MSRSPAPQDEVTFVKSHLATLASLRVTYPSDYVPPLQDLPRRPPILQIPVLPPPGKKEPIELSTDSFKITVKSLKPPVSFSLEISPVDPISAVKQRLSELPRAPPAEAQRLLLKGKALADAKLVKEYDMSEGAVVNLMVKPGVEWTGEEKAEAEKPDLHITTSPTSSKPAHKRTPSTPGDLPIPTVVLSSETTDYSRPSTPVALPLDAMTGPPLGPGPQPTSISYHATISNPEFWVRLQAFLRMQFANESDADTTLEDWLVASKAMLSAGEIAMIRDAVGVVGMGGK